ncbi:MAG: DUF1844 domain-containing protein [Verrucomicrobiae bacterium]|nr:DUF1844 domain-containing protein [Verrucomicrobiae bacterium]MCP5516079.1 DUF1844 domain-containing protein [Verrucomicrobiales bacterium]MCP5526494.1 DUF1844 domain-containing protein [Verrucomicrobiales bacterium]
MSANENPPLAPGSESAADMQAALFASLVLQQTNMALMFLGRLPHPESGEAVKDLEGARMFIDTLGMLEAKTKGNLSPQEAQMLQQSLMTVRMAFVEASREPATTAGGTNPKPETATRAADAPGDKSETRAAPDQDEDGRKKFVKKY